MLAWYEQTFVGRGDQSFAIPHSAGPVIQAVRGCQKLFIWFSDFFYSQ